MEKYLSNDLIKFEVHSGGFMGQFFSVEKNGEVLLYTTYKSGYTSKKIKKIKPSQQAWHQFINVFDQSNIWE